MSEVTSTFRNPVDHLGRWERDDGVAWFELDLWDTGLTGEYGKQRLRYKLVIVKHDEYPVAFEGDDFCPSPGLDPRSDEVAGALLSFFDYYAESINHGSDEVPEFTAEQRKALAATGWLISMWSADLDPQP